MSIEELVLSNPKTHNITYFSKDAFDSFINGLEKYLAQLKGYQSIQSEFDIAESELDKEIHHVEWSLQFLKDKKDKSKDSYDIAFFGSPPVSEVSLRLWKSALAIERNEISQRRSSLIREHESIPKVLLDSIDGKLAKLDNYLQMGLFAQLEPLPLMIPIADADDQQDRETEIKNVKVSKEVVVTEKTKDFNAKTNTKILEYTKERIYIYDDDLRTRVANLLKEEMDGQYDTALREVGVVLEDRIRRRSKAVASLHGDDLIQFALNPQNGALLVVGEQKNRQAFCRLITGFAEYIRNPNAHTLTGDVARERAIQVAAFADYLLSVLEEAKPR